MRNKLYFVLPSADIDSVTAQVLAARGELHVHTIPPAYSSALAVVLAPTHSLESALAGKYSHFPELHNAAETITQAHIDAFPSTVGLTLQDSTFTAMKKIHHTLGIAAMNPKA